MNLTDAPPGHAFEGDYPESHGDHAPHLLSAVQRQVDELQRGTTSSRAVELMGILRDRRSGHQDLPQLDVRTRRDGADVLVARGEIVMPSHAYLAPATQKILESHNFGSAGGAQVRRGGRFVRIRQATGVTDLERAVDECGRNGVTAWPNYVATMAAVGKGIGGAEPVGGIGTFSAYAIPSGVPRPGPLTPRVAIVDTGIPADRRGDGWLDSVSRAPDNCDLLDVLPGGPDGYLDFQAGHGTFVAGIIQRVAPGAEIRVYRAADTDGFATDDQIADAILRAFEDGAEIINLSLGGQTVDDAAPAAMAEAVQAVQTTSGGQVVIVAAAGNYGDATPCWPAALPGVEAVAGLTAGLTPAVWSSYGDVRFSTVAEGIRSTFVTGRESPVFDSDPEVFPADAWALWTGTSFAAPQIVGAIARICRETGLSARQAVDLLDQRGLPIRGFGKAMQILEGVR
jgi:subtilisin family serine protease